MRLTFTGIDEWTDLDDLSAIASTTAGTQIEWAVLAGSPTGTGSNPRFPGLSRIHRLRRLGQEQGIATAIHLCGRLARRVNAGNGETLAELVDGFDRIQVNAASYDYRRLIQFRTAIDTPVIVQDRSNFAETPPAARLEYLLDPSGGRGIESIHAWVRPWPGTQYGFAGGVGPENIRLAIDKLNELGAPNAWIDMETGVRSGNRFDLEKVRAVIAFAAAQPAS